MRQTGWLRLLYTILPVYAGAVLAAEPPPVPDPQAYRERARRITQLWESDGLAQPFVGITTDGNVQPGLFKIRSTGVSTAPVREAAGAFLGRLDAGQRRRITFPVDDIEWRKWSNTHIYLRDGISFEEMNEDQRAAAFDLLGASLSARGLKLTRDIMRLNETLAELRGNNFLEYGEWKYSLSVMGEPSATEPWGWQLDGHHLIINYFVFGDQVVMTPAFWGSEPVVARAGKYQGTRILQEEREAGLAMLRALDPEQREQAVLKTSKKENRLLADAFSDNLVLDYTGVRASTFDPEQKRMLLDLIGLYTGNMREGHARVRMEQVKKHLDDTWFAWMGEAQEDSVYYYRIHSPVILIEFDHQKPIALRHVYPDVPQRDHIHTVVRTPNGNDYGKDLLRQHYERYPHGQGHSHGEPAADHMHRPE